MKRIVIVSIIIAGTVSGFFLLFLLISTVTEYSPGLSSPLINLHKKSGDKELPPFTITVFTWNIGYGGLDAEMDFIIDGGKKSIADSRKRVLENMKAIQKEVTGTAADFYFFQEVDRSSNRSYSVDEVEIIMNTFPLYSSWFAKNFHVLFVPYPVFQPIGPVHSGILTLSKYQELSSTRISLPGQYDWPVKLFHLKRCMSVLRLQSQEAGKYLYLINLHLSAYDRQGELRTQQLAFIKDTITEIYKWRHYIIAGGDWNALIPEITKSSFGMYSTEEKDLFWVQMIPDDWTPDGWQWAYDAAVPTCRSLEAPYEKGKNFTTIIDGFLVSPNIEILDVKGFDLDFRYSDHNPVMVKVMLKAASS